ncbi:GTPase IMAP family member 2-like isoform X2 [Trachinotus anak]|uniref:GTPase IMAP family member 2-like isoform X2 n=1 Tax=Trachinotus anak TaxID=443729 RepID=UPI0039F21B85
MSENLSNFHNFRINKTQHPHHLYTTNMAYRQLGCNLSSDLRVVLVGQERVGKSSAGNTILGKREFDCKFSSSPLTLISEKREDHVLGRRVSVVDTPGLFSTRLSEEQVKAQLEEALRLSSPGPNVFLLTIQLGRFTEQEQKGLETLKKLLSPDVSKHTMVLFTYGDRLEDIDMDQFIKEDKNLQELLKNCSGQYQVFNNKKMEDRDQVKELFDKIDSVSEGGRWFYERSSQLLSLRVLRFMYQSYCWLFNTICSIFRWLETHIE